MANNKLVHKANTPSNKPNKTKSKGGRPPFELSVRSVAKYKMAKDPKAIEAAVERAFKILADEKSETQDFFKVLDWATRVLGGYDPQETKDVTPKQVHENQYKQFTRAELKKMLKGKL